MHHDLAFIRYGKFNSISNLWVVRIATTKAMTRDGALDALIASVATWIKKTAAGHSAWEQSSEDLNIGDLAQYLDDPDLQAQCRTDGIESVEILYELAGGDEVCFDRILAHGAELEPEEG